MPNDVDISIEMTHVDKLEVESKNEVQCLTTDFLLKYPTRQVAE